MGVDILGLAEWNLLISRRYINIHYISLLQNKKVNRKKLVFDRPSTNLVKSKACTAVSILWSENIQPTALLSYEKRHKGIVKPRHLSKEKSTKHNTTKPWYHCITNSEQFIMDLKHSHNTDISIYWKRKQISNPLQFTKRICTTDRYICYNVNNHNFSISFTENKTLLHKNSSIICPTYLKIYDIKPICQKNHGMSYFYF